MPTPQEIKSKFEAKHDFECRKKESDKILNKYSGYLAIIAEPLPNDANINRIVNNSGPKSKYLVKSDMTLAQFQAIIRKRINLMAEESIYLFTKDISLPPTNWNMRDLANYSTSDDGFIYLFYGLDNVYG